MKNEWTLTGLYQSMLEDLKLCHTQLERDCCLSICRREILDKAEQFKATRKLNPGEQAVLDTILANK